MTGREFQFDSGSAADLVAALAHPIRMQALQLLLERERDVEALAQEISIQPPLLSQHLAVLRSRKLVICRRDGTSVYYACHTEGIRKMMSALSRL